MTAYTTAIESTDPTGQWQIDLIGAVEAKDGNVQNIHSFSSLHLQTKDFQQATELFSKTKASAKLICLPLIHPKHYKHYLRWIAQLAGTLKQDPRTVVVFDLRGISVARDEPVSTRSMEALISWLLEEFTSERIWKYDEAVDHLVERSKWIV